MKFQWCSIRIQLHSSAICAIISDKKYCYTQLYCGKDDMAPMKRTGKHNKCPILYAVRTDVFLSYAGIDGSLVAVPFDFLGLL